jgi:hypothetical protein
MDSVPENRFSDFADAEFPLAHGGARPEQSLGHYPLEFVTPVEAGVQRPMALRLSWIPACAGMTMPLGSISL